MPSGKLCLAKNERGERKRSGEDGESSTLANCRSAGCRTVPPAGWGRNAANSLGTATRQRRATASPPPPVATSPATATSSALRALDPHAVSGRDRAKGRRRPRAGPRSRSGPEPVAARMDRPVASEWRQAAAQRKSARDTAAGAPIGQALKLFPLPPWAIESRQPRVRSAIVRPPSGYCQPSRLALYRLTGKHAMDAVVFADSPLAAYLQGRFWLPGLRSR